MKAECPTCKTMNLGFSSFTDNIDALKREMSSPWNFAALSALHMRYMFKGIPANSGRILRCKACQAYAIECGHCKTHYRADSLPDGSKEFTCPHCGKNFIIDGSRKMFDFSS